MRASLALLLVSSPALASPRIELGVALGGHAFSSDTELGVDDAMTEPGPASAALLGARVGVAFGKRLAAEAELTYIPTEDDVLGEPATVYGLRAHGRFDLLTGRVRPFVVAGLGGHIVRTSSPQMDDDTDRAYHWGGGARVAISRTLEARLDLRHLLVPDRTLDGATSDLEITAGVTYRFGGATKRPLPPRVVLAPPVEDEPEPPPPPPPPAPEPEILVELAGIGFERDSARFDAESVSILERAYEVMRDRPGLSVVITGHTSSDGDPERNLELSLARARAVQAYLVTRGIARDRVHAVGRGADEPIGDNLTEAGRRQNRRIEFRVVPAGSLP